MDTIFAKVAGLGVHQKFITVGVRCRLDTGKTFAPPTDDYPEPTGRDL